MPTVAANWMAEIPRFRRSFPKLVSISGIRYLVIFNRGHRQVTLSRNHYIDILTGHALA